MARTAIVSGGTGGLGRAVVAAFLERGDRVVLPWIVASERDAAAARHESEVAAGRLVLVEADVAEPAGAEAVRAAAGSCDVLVNGVGGFEGGTPVHDGELEAFDRMYRINLRSAACLSRALLPDLCSRGAGAVVLVASQAALDCPAGLAAYSASKAGVGVLTRTLQKEVASRGVRVNAVSPTTIDTPANRAAMPDADFSAWTAPEAIASVILWLTSPDAAAVRGAVVPV